jgi:hypothetical protein
VNNYRLVEEEVQCTRILLPIFCIKNVFIVFNQRLRYEISFEILLKKTEQFLLPNAVNLFKAELNKKALEEIAY